MDILCACGEPFSTTLSSFNKGKKQCDKCGIKKKENKVTFKCDYCHEEKTVRKSDYEGHKHHFCSRECKYFIVRAKYAKFPNDARYGLIVTKRTFKHAVDRNRAKRLLRDWIRFHNDMMLPNMDYIFVARAPILRATRDDGRTAMRKALHWIKKNI